MSTAFGVFRVAHHQAQLHKIPGTTQGQAPQTYSYNSEQRGSSGHQGQLWSCAEMPSVTLRSPGITQIDSFRRQAHGSVLHGTEAQPTKGIPSFSTGNQHLRLQENLAVNP